MEQGNASNAPSLVEPTIKYFISDALKKTHEYKMKTYSMILNVVIGTLFFLVFGGFLYYKYQSKPSHQEKYNKMMRDQQIIMSKIHSYQDDKKRATFSDITNLPFVDMDYYVTKP
jgi:hypothetical protein